jgi:AbrB family looped-hinge helix DNA binding protein
VVIPKEIRDRHGIKPGDVVEIEDVEGRITVRRGKTKAEIVDELLGSLPPSEIDPLKVLLEERRRDREREDRR